MKPAGLAGEAYPVLLEKSRRAAVRVLSPYIKGDGRKGQTSGQEPQRALEDGDAPGTHVDKPAGGLDPQAGRDPQVVAPVLERPEAAIGAAFPEHAVEGFLERPGKAPAQGFLEEERERGRGVIAHTGDALEGRRGQEAPGFEPIREIDEAPLEAVLRGAIEQDRELAKGVDLHVDPRGVEHGQAEPRENEHEQDDDETNGPRRGPDS